eukprot:EST42857.1 Hypothetical protein SS50377_17479 [Spironucleus salmonicida]
MRCLDALVKLMEIQEFHRRSAVNNHKFTGNEDFESASFKAYSVDPRKLSLLGIVDVCCWKLNNRIQDIIKQVRVLLGCGQNGSEFHAK